MSGVIKIDYDDGYKSVQLGNDPNRVIRINPNDANFLDRLSTFGDKIDEIQKKYGDIGLNKFEELKSIDPNDPDFEKMKLAVAEKAKIESAIHELINSIFGYDISAVVFSTDSCITNLGGEPLFMRFMNSIAAYMAQERAADAKKAKKIVNNYTNQRNAFVGKRK